jgi:hypothetical protein
MGALKLGLSAGLAYTFGGDLGVRAVRVIKPDLTAEGTTGAAWAGRIASFVLLTAILSRI